MSLKIVKTPDEVAAEIATLNSIGVQHPNFQRYVAVQIQVLEQQPNMDSVNGIAQSFPFGEDSGPALEAFCWLFGQDQEDAPHVNLQAIVNNS